MESWSRGLESVPTVESSGRWEKCEGVGDEPSLLEPEALGAIEDFLGC